jgi:hypothetical protein
MSPPIREYPGHLWVMSMGQPNGALVFSRRQREQLEGMAISGSLSAGLAVRVPIVFPNASGKHIRQIARQMGLFEIDSASPSGISAPEIPVSRSIAT